ncbi:MAG: tRNA dihydrouridine synthase DusB [Acidobacteria bacterium]|nr:tRNA dihydrouridine synthase DusB [Acidobacteriota bacterium]
MFKIRDVTIDPPLVLAPVAGHTDSLFRQAVKGLGGCGLVVSELVSTEGLTRRHDRTHHLTRFVEAERPVSMQIFGSDSGRMAESAAMVEAMGADIVDINAGCPVKKVVRQGGGSSLLRDLPLLEKIIKEVRKAVRIPLTLKIRSGWDRSSINAVEVLKVAEDCGVECLAIHGRTRSELFSGRADWEIIAKVKREARIPVIGNGDVFSPGDASRMFRETGVDGVMIGRGALGNPWLIRQCWDHLSARPVAVISLKQKADFMKKFLERVGREAPAPAALGKMKKIGGYLSRGLPQGAGLRARMHGARSIEEFFGAVEAYLADSIPAE